MGRPRSPTFSVQGWAPPSGSCARSEAAGASLCSLVTRASCTARRSSGTRESTTTRSPAAPLSRPEIDARGPRRLRSPARPWCQAQQPVGIVDRNSSAQIRSASAMVRYGARESATSSTVSVSTSMTSLRAPRVSWFASARGCPARRAPGSRNDGRARACGSVNPALASYADGGGLPRIAAGRAPRRAGELVEQAGRCEP